MAVPAAYERNITMSDCDRQVTKVTTGYVGILILPERKVHEERLGWAGPMLPKFDGSRRDNEAEGTARDMY